MTLNLEFILGICAVIVAIGGAVTYVKKAITVALTPHKDVKERLDRDYRRLNQHDKQLEELQKDMKQSLLSTSVMLGHMESGNNTGEIAERHRELEKYLINK